MLQIYSSVFKNWLHKIWWYLRTHIQRVRCAYFPLVFRSHHPNPLTIKNVLDQNLPLALHSNFSNPLNIVGIIAGNGLLPISLAESFIKQGGQCYIVALEGEADPVLYKNFTHQFFKIGMVRPIIEYFRKYDVKNIILAGGVNRPNFKAIKVDLMGSRLLARILKQKFLGDDKLLSIVTDFLEEKGFQVISSYEILSAKKGSMTIMVPSGRDNTDIELGMKLLDGIGHLDVGQSVIVDNGYIIGIEAAEGTDNLIKRCSHLRKNSTGGVLVKMMKKGQDTRIDIPTIGPETIKNLANYGYKGVAIQKEKVIVIELERTIELANKCRLFIIEK
ncbi:MAG: UDP-2,3-diacylglucosamine diphosphatase LpxI [Rickettsia endosymbiont of Pseudomimeciton antennatum]|nr:UDP-2,3-diacylglucosamine diphosphatase LpxI [Rickettsia endosymbiont of Pseudomimeciton antennatum]